MYEWKLADPKRLARELKPINQPQPSIWRPQFSSGVSGTIQWAVSIRQPYAEAILRGEKDIEYRSRDTKIRERVYIYASKGKEEKEVFEEFGIQENELSYGLIVGTVEIVDAVLSDDFLSDSLF